MEIALIILGVILFFLVSWFIRVQNKLVNLDELCENGLSQIGIQQTSRWDALNSMADLVSQYSEYEGRTLKEIIQQRNYSSKFGSASELEMNELQIKEALSKLSVVVEAYPELKSNGLYLNTMEAMRQYEENVRYSRMMYNDVVTKFNREIRLIPVCFIAKILGFVKKDYLDVDTKKVDMPNLKRI